MELQTDKMNTEKNTDYNIQYKNYIHIKKVIQEWSMSITLKDKYRQMAAIVWLPHEDLKAIIVLGIHEIYDVWYFANYFTTEMNHFLYNT